MHTMYLSLSLSLYIYIYTRVSMFWMNLGVTSPCRIGIRGVIKRGLFLGDRLNYYCKWRFIAKKIIGLDFPLPHLIPRGYPLVN